MFPCKGTLTLTPGMEGGTTIPQNHEKSQKEIRTSIVHTSGTCFKNVKKHFQHIFICTENDTGNVTGSDKRIKNNHL